MYERDCCFSNLDYLHDASGFCWYGECCGDFWWSVKRCEHIVYLQRADDHDDSTNNAACYNASNNCSSSDDGS